MELADILRQQAEYTRNSNYKVVVDDLHSWVIIECQDKGAETHDNFDLQGQEAETFLAEVKKMWQEVPTLDYDTVLYAAAKEYVDAI